MTCATSEAIENYLRQTRTEPKNHDIVTQMLRRWNMDAQQTYQDHQKHCLMCIHLKEKEMRHEA